MPRGKPFQAGNTGRPKGAVNKRTSAREACLKVGLDPFEFLAEVAFGKRKATIGQRIQAAKELCEYLEPKLSRQEIKAEVENKGGVALIPVLPGENVETAWTRLYLGKKEGE